MTVAPRRATQPGGHRPPLQPPVPPLSWTPASFTAATTSNNSPNCPSRGRQGVGSHFLHFPAQFHIHPLANGHPAFRPQSLHPQFPIPHYRLVPHPCLSVSICG